MVTYYMLKSGSRLPKNNNEKSFKNNEKYFLFHVKSFLLLRYLHFCPDFPGYVEKQLDKRAMVDSKIYDVTE